MDTWLVVVIVIIAILGVVSVYLRGRGSGSESTVNTNFKPAQDNDKVILVKGWDETDLTKIIRDFVATYENQGYPAYTIEPHQQSENFYRLTFPQDLHPMLFTFLINYLAYPFDLDLTNRPILVAGQTTLNSGFAGIGPDLVGKKAFLYIPENDEEQSVVYLRTDSGDTLAISFGEMKWKRVNDARLSSEVKALVE